MWRNCFCLLEARNSYKFWQSHKSEKLAKKKFHTKKKNPTKKKDQEFSRVIPNLLSFRGGNSVKKHFIAISKLKKKGKGTHSISLTVDYLCLFLHGANYKPFCSSQMTIHIQIINDGQYGLRLFLVVTQSSK